MKVILSVEPIKYPLTGIGRYTYELAKALAQDHRVETLRFMGQTHLLNKLPEPAHKPGAMEHLRAIFIKNKMAAELYRLAAPRLKHRALRGLEDHLYHGPGFYLPPFDGRSVVTIHDLTPYLWTECLPPERVRFMQPEIELSLKRAAMLITVSEFVRQETAAYFGWSIDRIRAVPPAGAEIFFPRAASETTSVLDQYGLSPQGYSLFAGTIEPRKNIAGLLDAYSLLPERIKQRWPLILTGYEGWKSEALHRRIATATRSGWARYLGFVPADHLPFLFSGARLFVFPSLYEGFGLPVLEAMSSAVPVVCSNAASLPEVAGDAAAMCGADDTDTLSVLIQAGLEDDNWRNQAIMKGLNHATRFSWKRCAQETIGVYQAALSM